MLQGVWNVTTFTPTTSRWLQLTVRQSGQCEIVSEGNQRLLLRITNIGDHHDIHFSVPGSRQVGQFLYRKPDDQHLSLQGELNHEPFVAQLERPPAKPYLLTTRGFHWINEDPLYR